MPATRRELVVARAFRDQALKRWEGVDRRGSRPNRGPLAAFETSSTGLGSMLTFHSNGVVDFSPGAVVEMTYRIEGGEMIFPLPTINGPEQRQKMEFMGQDQLRLAEVVFRRQGAPTEASHLILGEWVGKRQMNGRQLEAHYFFYPAGKCLLLLPFMTGPGRYTIQGSTTPRVARSAAGRGQISD